MAAPATWSGWLAGLWSSLWGAPAAGSPEAELEEKRVGALLEKESAKPEGQQDGERIRQLDVQYTKLMLANLQADARQLAIDVSMLESPATGRDCCAASDWVRRRTAASSRAVLDYFQQCIVQLTEQLAAEETGRPIEVVVQPTLRLDLPEALQQQPPWLDVCSVCASEMKQIEVDEEACRVHMQHLPEDLRAEGRQGIPAAAATSPGEAGATAAAADLPAQQAQQQQQQQKCGGARDAGSADGAPTTPTEQPAVLRLRQHGSSDREQEQQDAADEQCLLPREARCQQLEPR